MPAPDQPTNGHDEQALREELARFDSPEKRIAFLKKVGVLHHFFVSSPELAAIQAGTNQLQGAVRNWQVLSQVIFGVSTPEQALEVAKQQKLHRKNIFDDRMRFREALMKIPMCPEQLFDREKIRVIARDAINNIKSESGK